MSMSIEAQAHLQSSAAVENVGAWIPTTYALRFPLWGGRELGQLSVRALVWNAPLSRSIAGAVETPPESRCPAGIDGYFVPAQPVIKPTGRLGFSSLFITYVVKTEKRYFIRLEGAFQDYMNFRSSKYRKNLARQVRIFERSCDGAIDWRMFEGVEELAKFYPLAAAVSEKSYQHELGVGMPSWEQAGQMVREQSSHGESVGCILFFKGKPIAYDFCIINGDTLIGAKTGYDSDYAKLAPGKVLFYLLAERLFLEKRFRVWDFGQSEYAYKASLASDAVCCARTMYLRRSPRLFAFACLHYAYSLAHEQALRIARRYRARQAVGNAGPR